MSESITQMLDRAELLHAENEAVVDGERRLSWAQVAERVRRLGAGLRELGLERGAVVAVLMGNCLEYVECWIGLPCAGLVLTPLNARLAQAELSFILEDCDAAALIADDEHLPTALELAQSCKSIRHLIHAGATAGPQGTTPYAELIAAEERRLPAIAPEELAGIFYTGGTSGLPKGVMLTHANLTANAKHVLIALEYSSRDRYLHAGPMFHLADGSCTLAVTWVGATHVTVPRFEPSAVASTVARERTTAVVLVPTMINALVNEQSAAQYDLSSMRYVIYGGSPMPSELLRKALELFDGELIQVFGMTEVSPLATMCRLPSDIRQRLHEAPAQELLRSAGVPLVGVEVEIRDADGSGLGPHDPGEVWIRGANVMAGYWNRPEETAAALDEDGWYHTGDVAYLDEQGRLFVVDRLKDMIISGGENVYSSEVENALYQHPAVLETVVFGIPDDHWGERVHAIVVPREPSAVSEQELIEHCRTLIAGYKLPRSITFSSTPLPKSGAGKILKRELREPFWADRTGVLL